MLQVTPMIDIQPKSPVRASRKPSRAPLLVASSRYTEPIRMPTATATMRTPRTPGSQVSCANRWIIGSQSPLVFDDGLDLLLGEHAAHLVGIGGVLLLDPDLTVHGGVGLLLRRLAEAGHAARAL